MKGSVLISKLQNINLSMIRIVSRCLSVSSRKSMDPIQAIFVNKIRAYAAESANGPGIYQKRGEYDVLAFKLSLCDLWASNVALVQ